MGAGVFPPAPNKKEGDLMNNMLRFDDGVATLNGQSLAEGTLLRVFLPVEGQEVYGRLERRGHDGAWYLHAGERRVRLLSGLRTKEV